MCLSEIRPGEEVPGALQKKKTPTGHSRQLKLDIADLSIGGVQNLFLELETRPRTELFTMHQNIEVDEAKGSLPYPF